MQSRSSLVRQQRLHRKSKGADLRVEKATETIFNSFGKQGTAISREKNLTYDGKLIVMGKRPLGTRSGGMGHASMGACRGASHCRFPRLVIYFYSVIICSAGQDAAVRTRTDPPLPVTKQTAAAAMDSPEEATFGMVKPIGAKSKLLEASRS